VQLAALALLVAATACAHSRDFWRDWREQPIELSDTPVSDLPAPEGLRAASGAYRMIPLSWDPLLRGNVGGYQLESAEQREGPYKRLAAVPGRGALSYVDRGGAEQALGDGVTRFYRLRAYTPDGRLAAEVSPEVAGTTAPLPEAPEALRAYSLQPREVPLSWNPADDPNVAGYAVERSPAPEGPFEVVATLDGRHTTSYLDAGLGDLRVFYYRVAARNPGGASGRPSKGVRAVTKPEPLSPIGLRVAKQALGANVLVWDPNVETDLVEYRLFRVVEGEAPWLVAAVPAEAGIARDGSVGAGEVIDYVLVAVDRDGLASNPSEPVRVESEGYGLSAEVRDDGVHLAWNPRNDEGFQDARLVRTAWLTRRQTAHSDSGRYVDRDVQPGRRYRYVATLRRADGSEAPASRPIDVRIPKDADLR
jgi:hypothetical protein